MENSSKEWEEAGEYKNQELRGLVYRKGHSRIMEILQLVGTRKVEFQCVRETQGNKYSETCYTQVIVMYEKVPYLFSVHYHPNAKRNKNPLHAQCLKNTCDDNVEIPLGGLFYNWLKCKRELSQWNLHE